MLKIKKWQVPVTIACLLTGMFAVSAFRTNTEYQNSRKNTNKNQNLVSIINYLEKETETLEERVKIMRDDIDSIQKTQVSNYQNAVDLQNKLASLRSSVGLTDATSPGIVITLDDNKAGAEAAKTNSLAYDPEDFIVHDKNILYLVTALRNAGAQAISVNGQRIITSSNIRCAGPIIIVNSSRLAPPYIIKAQGDPDSLKLSVEDSDEYVYIMSKGLPLSIAKKQNVAIKAFNGPVKFSYAQIQKEGAQ